MSCGLGPSHSVQNFMLVPGRTEEIYGREVLLRVSSGHNPAAIIRRSAPRHC